MDDSSAEIEQEVPKTKAQDKTSGYIDGTGAGDIADTVTGSSTDIRTVTDTGNTTGSGDTCSIRATASDGSTADITGT